MPERRDSQSSESVAQPDHEPDLSSRQLSPEGEPQDNSGQEDDQNIFLASCDEPSVLTTGVPENFAWRNEYEMTIPECHQHRPPSQSCKEAAIRSATVRTHRHRTGRIRGSQQAEVSNWVGTDTISKILKIQVPSDQILKCRWILTWKPLDQTGIDASNKSQRTHKAKARIVVFGYMDPNIENIPRDSPTMSKTSRMMLLQILATHRWAMESFDIKAAFLQGKPQAGRLIAVDPVPELRRALDNHMR